MNRLVGENELQSNQAPRSAKKGTRDSDALILVWEVLKTRTNEIDGLLDLSLSILSATPDFPEKPNLEDSLKKALTLVRNFA
jgi:hypothetical protein